jgi:uncharacterized protein YjiS (DUF1127 family)
MMTHNPIAARPHGLRAAIGAAQWLLRTLRRHLQARATIATLHRLSDDQLRDIGLRRADVYRRFRP